MRRVAVLLFLISSIGRSQVTSFNARTGTVTLNSSDLTNAHAATTQHTNESLMGSYYYDLSRAYSIWTVHNPFYNAADSQRPVLGQPVFGYTANLLGEGYALGNCAGCHGWTGSHLLDLNMYIPQSGLHQGLGQSLVKTGADDFTGIYTYMNDSGGLRAASDEGVSLQTKQNGQNPEYTGTVTTGGVGTIYATETDKRCGVSGQARNCSGQNRYVLRVSDSSNASLALSSGRIKSISQGYQTLNGLTQLNLDVDTGTVNKSAAIAALGYKITAFSITSNVVTIQALNTLTAGSIVTISGLSVGLYLNGQNLTVLNTDLNSTQFKAAFTHSDVSSTNDSGTAGMPLPDNQINQPVYSSRQFLYPYSMLDGTSSTFSAGWGCLAGSEFVETVALAISPDAFDPTKLYVMGQYVAYGGTIYRAIANQPVKAPGTNQLDPSVDSAHWAIATVPQGNNIFITSRYPNVASPAPLLFQGACTYMNLTAAQTVNGERNAHVIVGASGPNTLVTGYWGYGSLGADPDLAGGGYLGTSPVIIPGARTAAVSGMTRNAGVVTAIMAGQSYYFPPLVGQTISISGASDDSFNGTGTGVAVNWAASPPVVTWNTNAPGTATTTGATLTLIGLSGYEQFSGEELRSNCDPSITNGYTEAPNTGTNSAQCTMNGYLNFYDSAVTFNPGDHLEQPVFVDTNLMRRKNDFITCYECGESQTIALYGPKAIGRVFQVANSAPSKNFIGLGGTLIAQPFLAYNGPNGGLASFTSAPHNGQPLINIYGCLTDCSMTQDYPLLSAVTSSGAAIISISPSKNTISLSAGGGIIANSFSAPGSLSAGSTAQLTVDSSGNMNTSGKIGAALYTGPATAPSGGCTAIGWVFSQDGHATFCNGSMWVTKI